MLMQHCSHSRPALIRVARIPTATFFGVFDGGSGRITATAKAPAIACRGTSADRAAAHMTTLAASPGSPSTSAHEDTYAWMSPSTYSIDAANAWS
jgi:hypothetical protein